MIDPYHFTLGSLLSDVSLISLSFTKQFFHLHDDQPTKLSIYKNVVFYCTHEKKVEFTFKPGRPSVPRSPCDPVSPCKRKEI